MPVSAVSVLGGGLFPVAFGVIGIAGVLFAATTAADVATEVGTVSGFGGMAAIPVIWWLLKTYHDREREDRKRESEERKRDHEDRIRREDAQLEAYKSLVREVREDHARREDRVLTALERFTVVLERSQAREQRDV